METLVQMFIAGCLIPLITQYLIKSKLDKMLREFDTKKVNEEEISTLIIKSIRVLTDDILAIFDSLKSGTVDKSLEMAEEKTQRISDELEDHLIKITSRKQ